MVYRGKVVFYRFCQWGFCMKAKSALGDITTHCKIYIHTFIRLRQNRDIYKDMHLTLRILSGLEKICSPWYYIHNIMYYNSL